MKTSLPKKGKRVEVKGWAVVGSFKGRGCVLLSTVSYDRHGAAYHLPQIIVDNKRVVRVLITELPPERKRRTKT